MERGRCPRHLRPRRDNRPSPSQRGYDWAWIKLRKVFATQNPPICVRCGISTEDKAMHVDHIVGIREAPERRLDITNLQWLCQRCHNTKTSEAG